jgi:hypothetical protein
MTEQKQTATAAVETNEMLNIFMNGKAKPTGRTG